MKKNTKFVLGLVAILAIFCLLFVFACKPPEEQKGETKTEDTAVSDGLTITNGRFATTGTSSSKIYVKKDVKGWTATNGAISTSYSGVSMGIIDLTKDLFDTNANSIMSNLEYPGIAPNTPKEGENYVDKNALLIAIPTTVPNGSLMYTSSEIKVEKGIYYKISLDVYTNILSNTEKGGAAVILTDGVFSQNISINTNKKWNTYTYFVEASKFEEKKFKVQLWLGNGPKKIGSNESPYMAAGIALFDNVVMEKIDETAYKTATASIGLQEKKFDENGNFQTNISLTYIDPGFTQYNLYDATSQYSTNYFYSAKSGPATNLTFYVGKEDLAAADKDKFPTYNTYQTDTFPLGIFDMSKLYTFDGDTPTDTYSKIYTSTGGFQAPNFNHFYKKIGEKWEYNLLGDCSNGRTGASYDSTALLIYHPNHSISGAGYKTKNKLQIEKNKFYEISVWVYVWVPDMAEPTSLTEQEQTDPAKVKKYEEDKAHYDKYMEYLNGERDVNATFRVSGASVTQDAALEQKSTGIAQWQKLTLRIQGNELSSRFLNLEFWYGEGKWDEPTLFPGAAFFDDVDIKVYETVANPEDYHQLSILQKGDFKGFGLIDTEASNQDFTYLKNMTKTLWKEKTTDPRTSDSSYAVGIIGGLSDFVKSTTSSTTQGLAGISAGPNTLSIKYDGSSVLLDVLTLNNIDPTALDVSYKITEDDIIADPTLETLLKVLPNSFYRLSMWVKTNNIPAAKGGKIEVFAGNSESSFAKYENLNIEEWTEIILYVQGKMTSSERLNMKVTLGTGDIFNSDAHVKGAMFITGITWQKISYDEYNNADTNISNTKKQQLSETNTSSQIQNGSFASIENSNFNKKELFDEDGNIIKEATPSSWSLTNPKTVLATPQPRLNDAHTELTWEAINKATSYYVYMNNYPKEGSTTGEKENDVLVAKVDTNSYVVGHNGIYYVRAVGGIPEFPTMISEKSKTVTASKFPGETVPPKSAEEDIFSIKSGIINYLHYEGIPAADRDAFYGKPEEGYYKSTLSNNLLIVQSKADTYTGYTMTSDYTITKDKYYLASVWVKTIGTARASITLKNASSTLAIKQYPGEDSNVDGNYVGFTNINTGGKWRQYWFLLNSNLVNGKVQFELFLGNPYGVSKSTGAEATDITYPQGLSKGVVYFDDANIEEITTKEIFNLRAYGIKEYDGTNAVTEENKVAEPYTLAGNKEYTGSIFKDEYVFKIMDFKTDSFDGFTDAADEFLGKTPSAYKHSVASEGKSYQKPTADLDEPNMFYGVYSAKTATDKIFTYLKSMGYDESQIRDFVENGTGNGYNYLMMANIVENGQRFELNSGFEIKTKSYYKITFSAKLFAPQAKFAEFRFVYGDDTTKWSTVNITERNLKTYTFYVYNDKPAAVTGNKISFSIGTNDGVKGAEYTKNFFKGILIVDDVTIEQLPDEEATKTAFAEAKENEKYSFAAPQEETEPENQEKTEDEKTKNKVNPQIWLVVASVVIGAVIILAVIAVFVKRIKENRKKKGKGKKKVLVQSKVSTTGDTEAKKVKSENRVDASDSDIFDD